MNMWLICSRVTSEVNTDFDWVKVVKTQNEADYIAIKSMFGALGKKDESMDELREEMICTLEENPGYSVAVDTDGHITHITTGGYYCPDVTVTVSRYESPERVALMAAVRAKAGQK